MKSDITSKTIDGITDLVVWAPIKQGFVDAFSNITYEARLRLAAEALHNVRRSAREHELISPFPDTAERILSLLDFRIGIVDENIYGYKSGPSGHTPQTGLDDKADDVEDRVTPRRYMYLVATFDGPWEPYMRLIWNPLGAFLDLLLCNCEGYISAVDNSFEKYAQWVRDHQLDSAIFYSTSGLTVKDKNYLEKLERLEREGSEIGTDLAITRMTSDDPEDKAKKVRTAKRNKSEVLRLALEALTVLYKLADYYPADRIHTKTKVKNPDRSFTEYEGTYLLRVARSILSNWSSKKELKDKPGLRAAYAAPLDWFETDIDVFPAPKETVNVYHQGEVQKGLVTSYDVPGRPMTHGVLLMMKVTDLEKAKSFILDFPCSWEASTEDNLRGSDWEKMSRNLVFTFHGLKRFGLSKQKLMMFPKEFREGAESRAPVNGDKFHNHPRRWTLPDRYPNTDNAVERPVVEMHEVDFAIHLRTAQIGEFDPEDFIDFETGSFKNADAFSDVLAQDPMLGPIAMPMSGVQKNAELPFTGFTAAFQSVMQTAKILSENKYRMYDYTPFALLIYSLSQIEHFTGVKVIAVESMFRPDANDKKDDKFSADETAVPTTDHFGFRDGLSQPVVVEKGPLSRQTDVRRGEILIGYTNGRNDNPSLATRSGLLRNGSYLAVRKMAQDVDAFHTFLNDTATPEISQDEVAARIMGRYKDGTPLITAHDNEFDYAGDPEGTACPFASHVRRANPRKDLHGRKSPLILRRGMSYGHRYSERTKDKPRGIMFMAYCASLAEQYEIVLRWINGGNSTDVSSAQFDPLCGPHMPGEGEAYTYRSEVNGKVERWKIKKPFVTLQWANYFFVPSRRALDIIAAPSAASDIKPRISAGRQTIQKVERLSAQVRQAEWKRLLEDYLTKDPTQNNISPDVWAAISAKVDAGGYGGAIKLDAGVATDPGRCPHAPANTAPVMLVADEDLIDAVLKDHETFSVKEQGRRMDSKAGAFGMIYVARDPSDPDYANEAYPTNDFLYAYSEKAAFNDGYKAGVEALVNQKSLAEVTAKITGKKPNLKLELGRQYISIALGHLCRGWFGVPDLDEAYFKLGGWSWNLDPDRTPFCPGDFMSPSRYGFYPRPTRAIEAYGKRHGASLRKAVKQMVKDGKVTGKIGEKIAFKHAGNPDIIERNLIGIMIGALPPMDANLRFAFLEWLNEDTLWSHQGSYLNAIDVGMSTYRAGEISIKKPLMESMSVRPAPDLIYRTATQDYKIGEAHGKAGDTIILSLVGATQNRAMKNETPNVNVVFGNSRSGTDHPDHGCPAQSMAMGGMMGILAAFFDSGRVQALPSSLIVKLTDWEAASS